MAHTIVLIATCGSSSVVEHHLAKVGVAEFESVFRSIILPGGGTADAQDLKSCGERSPYRFDSVLGTILNKAPVAQLDRAFDYGSRVMGSTLSGASFKFYFLFNYIREVARLGRALGLGPRSQVRILSSRLLK